MPIIERAKVQSEELFSGVQSRGLVRKEAGAQALTVNEVAIGPGSQVPLHIHPHHEEAMVVLEGEAEATLGQEVRTVGPGHIILAPPGVSHRLVNHSNRRTVRLLAIFPTTEPQRRLLPEHK